MSRPTLRKCYGTNPKTGKGVGERHSWRDFGAGLGNWGKGRCYFCCRYLDELLVKAELKVTLAQPLKGE